MAAILKRVFAIAAAVCVMGSAHADDEAELPVAPDDLVYCTVCHGVQLMGNETLEAPRLSGMETWYVENQLQAFRQGWRGTHPDDLVGMEMRPMAAGLSDSGIESAASFVGRAHSPPPAATIEGDAARGKTLYASCAACHGADGRGNETLAGPSLIGQNDWYMVRQLENYRDGVRGFAEDDVYGQRMRAAAGLLIEDQSIRDVVAYITTLQSN